MEFHISFFEKIDEITWGSLIHNFIHEDRYMLSSSSLQVIPRIVVDLTS